MVFKEACLIKFMEVNLRRLAILSARGSDDGNVVQETLHLFRKQTEASLQRREVDELEIFGGRELLGLADACSTEDERKGKIEDEYQVCGLSN